MQAELKCTKLYSNMNCGNMKSEESSSNIDEIDFFDDLDD